MNLQLLTFKIAQILREEGLQAIVRKSFVYLRRNRTPDDFDVRNGTDTGGFEPLWKFKIQSRNTCFGVHYKATGEQDLVDAVDALREELRAFTFIDLGCGKGRTLLVASRLGFHRVIGVEFAPELAGIARANLSRMSVANAIVLHGDAADFHFPDGPIVLYLYNPFSQEVMREVVGNLRKACLDRLYVIYKNPKFAETVLDTSGFLTRFGSLIGSSNIQIWRGGNSP